VNPAARRHGGPAGHRRHDWSKGGDEAGHELQTVAILQRKRSDDVVTPLIS
jgi:hypothetical protein